MVKMSTGGPRVACFLCLLGGRFNAIMKLGKALVVMAIKNYGKKSGHKPRIISR